MLWLTSVHTGSWEMPSSYSLAASHISVQEGRLCFSTLAGLPDALLAAQIENMLGQMKFGSAQATREGSGSNALWITAYQLAASSLASTHSCLPQWEAGGDWDGLVTLCLSTAATSEACLWKILVAPCPSVLALSCYDLIYFQSDITAT